MTLQDDIRQIVREELSKVLNVEHAMHQFTVSTVQMDDSGCKEAIESYDKAMTAFVTPCKVSPDKKFVVLEGLKLKNRFYTQNRPFLSEDRLVEGENGEVWYRILGYCDTASEALEIITKG